MLNGMLSVLHRGRKIFRGCETSYRGEKRLKLRKIVMATGAKRLEDGCETSWGVSKRLWCEMSWSLMNSNDYRLCITHRVCYYGLLNINRT